MKPDCIHEPRHPCPKGGAHMFDFGSWLKCRVCGILKPLDSIGLKKRWVCKHCGERQT